MPGHRGSGLVGPMRARAPGRIGCVHPAPTRIESDTANDPPADTPLACGVQEVCSALARSIARSRGTRDSPRSHRGRPSASDAWHRCAGRLSGGSGGNKGSVRAVTISARRRRVLTPQQRHAGTGTSPIPLLAGMGRRDSWNHYALKRVAARQHVPPSRF